MKLLYYSLNIFHIIKTFQIQWTLSHLQLIAREKKYGSCNDTAESETNMDVCAHAVIRKILYAKTV